MGACTSGMKGCCGHDARFGEYEFADIGADPNSRLTLTNKLANNTALVRHIKHCTSKIALAMADDLAGRQKALEQAVHFAPLLKLKVLNGNLLSGSELTITAQGFEGGYRREKDGKTYFGCKKRGWKNGIRLRHGEVANDVVVKLKDKDIGQLYRGRHFQIKYYPGPNCYRIKDLGVGFGTFLKLDKPLLIQDNQVIMLGDSFLILNLLPERGMVKTSAKNYAKEDSCASSARLKVTVYAGPANGEIFYFTPAKQLVKIGRINSCEIQIEDSLMSKYQAQIMFTERGWVLTDGYNGKASTNGSWLYIMEELEVYSGMTFKGIQTVFQAILQ